MKKESIEDELFRFGVIFLVAGIVGLVIYLLWIRPIVPQIPCFFSNVWGIYCPGCGGTRAAIALVHGQLLKSFWYHPLVPYSAIIGGGFMLTQGLHRLGCKRIKGWRYHDWFLKGFVLLFVCNFLLKNLLRLGWGITM